MHLCNLSLVVSLYDSDTLQTKKICGRRAWKEIASQVTSPDEEAQINGCQVVKREEAQIMVVKVLKDVIKS